MSNIHLTKIKDKASEFIRKHSSITAKLIFVLIVIAICLIPTYIGIAIWYLASPVGFWQVIIVMALLLICFGSMQAAALIIGFVIIISVLANSLS